MLKQSGIVLFLIAGGAIAEPALDWGSSGDWDIKVDPAVGHGCYMQRLYESGTRVRIGYVPNEQGAFFSAVNPDWPEVEEGAESSVIFDFGDSRFQGAVVGIVEDGMPGGYAFFNNPEFASEFGRRYSVTIQGEGGGSEDVDLSGSSAGLAALKKCQGEQG